MSKPACPSTSNPEVPPVKDFELEVIERLAELRGDVKEIKADLQENHRVLHGNGRPGLVSRVTVIENDWVWARWVAGIIGGVIGFAASLAAKCIFRE